jgi:hypothetical protein
LWSHNGGFCTGCDKFAFPDENLASEKLEALKAKRIVRKRQAGLGPLSAYDDNPVLDQIGAARFVGITAECLKKWRPAEKGAGLHPIWSQWSRWI